MIMSSTMSTEAALVPNESVFDTVSSFNEDDANYSVLDLYDDDDEGDDSSTVERKEILTTRELEKAKAFTSLIMADPENFDRYGFSKKGYFISQEEYDKWWTEYNRYTERRKKKWENFLLKNKIELHNDNPLVYPARTDELSKFVRKGIPAEWRGNAWWYFAGGQRQLDANVGVYDRLKSDCREGAVSGKDMEAIERDLYRTFPDNIHFHKESFQNGEPAIIRSLRRVLMAFSVYEKTIGYCQSMNFLVGLLLLFMEEEKAFWMLVIITGKYLPGVYESDLEGANVDQGVLVLCIKEYLPEIWSHIESSYMNGNGSTDQISGPTSGEEYLCRLPTLTLCTASWFMSCFVGVVPIETTLRIWDCLFYEESHFLFKVALGILKLSESEFLESKSQKLFRQYSSYTFGGSNDSDSTFKRLKNKIKTQEEADMEILQVIQNFPKRLLNPNDIFEKVLMKKKVALNGITQEKIDRGREYVAMARNRQRASSRPKERRK
ncbi:BBM_1a_G0047600.mRNA.1.CDS.1 [Saccharomyces cerevisiae]|nr:CPI_1c_G0047590.mRNA.1.CDS.1 [Saccharomyces cerevisiae]CAI4761511.1 BBM_1a_G0047600.mRNA.1.CDS.1 [Saccharomyces cerevisiae]CAI7322368.1 BBM_1a_G0047600.mRNA.1.CDS.1 [Saccharomyces cerevisiae]CAI7452253.1 CPI_1c_G0047590.mRNA.1.CDS.1 [Saccharomyces cerevisiae]